MNLKYVFNGLCNVFAVLLIFFLSSNTIPVPSFELCNKTGKTIYFFFGGKNDKDIFVRAASLGVGTLKRHQCTDAQSLSALNKVSAKDKFMFVSYSKPQAGSPVNLYKFIPSTQEETLYLDAKDVGNDIDIDIFPQETGVSYEAKSKALAGQKQNDRGYSLKNNILGEEIRYFGPKEVPSGNYKVDPKLTQSIDTPSKKQTRNHRKTK